MAPRRRHCRLLSASRWAITRSRRFRRISSLPSPTRTYLETFHPDRDPLFYALVANRSPFLNGNYKLPEGAGFGLKLDESVIARHRV